MAYSGSDPVVKLPWTNELASSAHSVPAKAVQRISILSGPNGKLERQLLAAGVPRSLLHDSSPDLLFVD
jgi:hypothetical protein